MKQKIFVVLLAFFVISCLFTFKINTIDAEVINNDQSGSCTIQSLRNCDRDGLIRILIELLLNFIENNQQPGSVPVEPIDEQENKQEDETSGDSSFIDSRDGQGYSIVKIGNQTWMGENLRYLPSVSGPGSGSKYSPFYYVNGYTGTNVLEAKKTYNYNEYGVLYNYSAALTACPSGWHLPSDQEWYELEKHLSSGSCQYNRYGEWDCAPAGSILKESKFRALMAASRDPNGNFYNLGANTSFWSSSRYLSDALYRKININENRIYRDPASLDYGFSVRCIKGYSNQDLIKIPSINIISPKSTDTLIAGKTYTVKWESSNLTGNTIQVVISGSGGRAVSYLPITATSYDWTIPSNYADNKASISINSAGSNENEAYEAYDTVVVNVTKETSTPYINIISPNPTDTLIAGKTYTVKWESSNLTGDKIEVSEIEDRISKVIATLPITATSYDWIVPSDYVIDGKGDILIGSFKNGKYEALDSVTVNVTEDASASPSINIIFPKPTDTLIAGKTYTVKWESRNLTGNTIKILESGGKPVTYLPSTATSYDWTIPSDYAKNEASISIGSIASNGKYEALDSVIVNVTKETSTPYINIIFPNPTDTLIAGKTYTVKWESRNLTGNTIQLVTSGPNGGGVATYLPITATSYNWTVPIDYANNKASISIDSVGSNVNEAYEAYDTVVVNVIKDASPYINIIFPNPTDTLIAGETYTIKWESSNLTGDWILVYADINLVAGASTSENQVLWTIPESYAGKTPKIYVKSSAKAGSVEAVDSVEVPIKAKESLPDLGIKDVNYYADYYIAVEYCNYGKEQLKVAPEIKATNTKTGQTRIYATSAPKPGECLGAHNTGFQVSSIGLIYGEDAQVRVEIDPDNKIKEGNEDNNILVKSIRANESPYIERINPSQGRPGEKVTIYGKYLFGYKPSGITIEWFRDGVSVGNTISPITESSDGRSLEFTLSNILFGNMGPGKYQIRVINDIGPSNLLDFSVIE